MKNAEEWVGDLNSYFSGGSRKQKIALLNFFWVICRFYKDDSKEARLLIKENTSYWGVLVKEASWKALFWSFLKNPKGSPELCAVPPRASARFVWGVLYPYVSTDGEHLDALCEVLEAINYEDKLFLIGRKSVIEEQMRRVGQAVNKVYIRMLQRKQER